MAIKHLLRTMAANDRAARDDERNLEPSMDAIHSIAGLTGWLLWTLAPACQAEPKGGGNVDGSNPSEDSGSLEDAAATVEVGEDVGGEAGTDTPSDPGDAGPNAMDGDDANVTTGPAVQIATGWQHTCVLARDSTVKCWGYNGFGEVGDGTGESTPNPTAVKNLDGVLDISARGSHTCARLRDRTVKCWGDNLYGQLGFDSSTTCPGGPCSTPKVVPGLENVAQIAAGGSHTCALLETGKVKCWGANNRGELGDGTATDRRTPTEVPGMSGVLQISAGAGHTCARMSDRTVRCWGSNAYGQLGYVSKDCTRPSPGDPNVSECSRSPQVVPTLSGVAEIDAGFRSTCARLEGGAVECWGGDSHRDYWRQRYLDRSAAQVTAQGPQGCARMSDRTVRCWGDGYAGDGSDLGVIEKGVGGREVPGLVDVDEVRIGVGWHLCARSRAGSVKCWGRNGSGQLGDGTTTERLSPVDVEW